MLNVLAAAQGYNTAGDDKVLTIIAITAGALWLLGLISKKWRDFNRAFPYGLKLTVPFATFLVVLGVISIVVFPGK